MKTFEPWNLEEIVSFLERSNITIVVTKSGPALTGGTDHDKATIIPHLKAKRDVVLDYFQAKWFEPADAKHGPFRKASAEELAAMRHGTLAAVVARAGVAGRPVWYLDGPEPKRYEPNKYKRPVPEACRFLCVEGDAEWTELPGSKTPTPPPVKAKYRSKWHRSRGI